MEGSLVPANRVPALDVVRAVSLFGVLVVNVDTQFRVSPFERFLPPGADVIVESTIDQIVGRVIAIGFDTKPLVLFSFLFGMGLAAQWAASRETRSAFGPRVVRRLAFLFALGIAHYVFLWVGDVLALYAAVASVAALLVALPSRWLLALAVALFAIQVAPLPYPRAFESPEALSHYVDATKRIYTYGSYLDTVVFRIGDIEPALALAVWSVPRTLGLFLLGAWSWKSRLFTRPETRATMVRVATAGLVAGGFATWFSNALVFRGVVHAACVEVGELGLAFAYGALIFVAAGGPMPMVGRALRYLEPIGRMTLTSYLLESVILGFVFYGYGFARFDRIGHAAGFGIATVLFAVQALFAHRYLATHRFGPLEGVWRSFTVRGVR